AAIERLPKLKLVSQTGRATAHIDVAACTERGIVVSAGGGRQSTRDGGTDLGAHSGRAAAYSLRSQTIERRPLAIDVGYRRATQDIGNIRSRQDWQHRGARGTDVRRAGALLGTGRLDGTSARRWL